MQWWRWFAYIAYLGVIAGIFARAHALFPGRPVKTLIIVESPEQPLTLEAAQAALAATGAIVVPGFTVTP